MMIADTNEGKPKPYSPQCGAPKGVAPYEHECRKTKKQTAFPAKRTAKTIFTHPSYVDHGKDSNPTPPAGS